MVIPADFAGGILTKVGVPGGLIVEGVTGPLMASVPAMPSNQRGSELPPPADGPFVPNFPIFFRE